MNNGPSFLMRCMRSTALFAPEGGGAAASAVESAPAPAAVASFDGFHADDIADFGFDVSGDSGDRASVADNGGSASAHDGGAEPPGDEDLVAALAETDGGEAPLATDNGLVEVEIDGAKHRVPKDLEPVFKGVSERAAAIKAEEVRVTSQLDTLRRNAQEQVHFQKELAQLHVLNEALGRFEKADLVKLVEEDPLGVQRLEIQRRALEKARSELTTTISGRVGEMRAAEAAARQKAEADRAQMVAASDAELAKEFGAAWGGEKTRSEIAAVLDEKFGIMKDSVAALSGDPKVMKFLKVATDAIRAVERSKEIRASRQQSAPPAPTAQIKGGAGRGRQGFDPDGSITDFFGWGNKHIGD